MGEIVRCAECRFYKVPDPIPEWRDFSYSSDGFGQCLRACSNSGNSESVGTLAFAEDAENHRAWLNVKPEFGCVMGERQESDAK